MECIAKLLRECARHEAAKDIPPHKTSYAPVVFLERHKASAPQAFQYSFRNFSLG